MLATEFITQLVGIIAEHGDLEVLVGDGLGLVAPHMSFGQAVSNGPITHDVVRITPVRR
jgi:hypothetical protein